MMQSSTHAVWLLAWCNKYKLYNSSTDSISSCCYTVGLTAGRQIDMQMKYRLILKLLKFREQHLLLYYHRAPLLKSTNWNHFSVATANTSKKAKTKQNRPVDYTPLDKMGKKTKEVLCPICNKKYLTLLMKLRSPRRQYFARVNAQHWCTDSVLV